LRPGWWGGPALLHIVLDSTASQRVAEATGFTRQDDQRIVERRRKGQVLHLASWQRALHPPAAHDRLRAR